MHDSMTVYELNKYASRLLQNDILLSMVDVSGEISNLKHHSSGHIYFNGRDIYDDDFIGKEKWHYSAKRYS